VQNALVDTVKLDEASGQQGTDVCVGRIVSVTRRGQALVDYPGNQGGPTEARSVALVLATPQQSLEGTAVLLVFENGDRTLPIIVGVIRDSVYPADRQEQVHMDSNERREVTIDGKKMVFDAKDEILLRCGKSSITLRKDGRIVVKGAHLVSRASGPNKIKGASIAIN